MGKLELQRFRKMQCHYTILDQYGNIVCMKNFEAPGDCDTLHCPYECANKLFICISNERARIFMKDMTKKY